MNIRMIWPVIIAFLIGFSTSTFADISNVSSQSNIPDDPNWVLKLFVRLLLACFCFFMFKRQYKKYGLYGKKGEIKNAWGNLIESVKKVDKASGQTGDAIGSLFKFIIVLVLIGIILMIVLL